MAKASPIRDLDDVRLIYRRLTKWERYRLAELFIIGCNVALRISDLLPIRVVEISEFVQGGEVCGRVRLTEKKTGKQREVTFNSTAMAAVRRLKERFPDAEYLFESNGNRASGKPFSRVWVYRIFNDVAESLDLDYQFSTHTLRKTFGYHAYKNGEDIRVLQRLFNHASVRETFEYIGITEERVQDVYLKVGIGQGIGI